MHNPARASVFGLLTLALGCEDPGSRLAGNVHGIVGEGLVLRNNGADDLGVPVVRTAGTSPYQIAPFEFATPLSDGAPYEVTIESAPLGQTCAVYAAAAGTMPQTEVLVGCETTDDLVSRSTDEAVFGTFFESTTPVLGGDDVFGQGRFVAFVSSAAMDGATGANRQVFWRDRLENTTLLVSASGGAEGDADSGAPAISADGLTVAFESLATNLDDGDANGVSDVFVWNANDRVAARVSVASGGAEADGGSFEPTLSANGSVVAFSSGASNLTPGVDGTSTINVYRRNVANGDTTLVSADAAGAGVGGSEPSLAHDGGRLAFSSFSSALVVGDTNDLWDIFTYDHAAGALTRVSLTSTGGERDQGTESASRVVTPSISGNGRFVAFSTTATNVVADDTNGVQDVFVVDTDTGDVVRASVGNDGAEGDADSPFGQGEAIAISADGRWVAFTTAASNLGTTANNVVMRDLTSGETRVVSSQTSSAVGQPSMSSNGAYVAFGAGAPLDGRFDSTGLFVHFTGVDSSWWWTDD